MTTRTRPPDTITRVGGGVRVLTYTHTTPRVCVKCWYNRGASDVADRNNRVVTYLTDAEDRRLREWSDETDKPVSQLVREAVHEYVDHDRTARVEGRLDEIEATLSELTDTLDADTTHTHKPEMGMRQSSAATEKARKIIRRIQQNHEEVIQAADVERAIEDIAGVDDRTIRKYQRLFRRRGLLFEHPGETSVWTTDVDQWVAWLEDYGRLNGGDAVKEVTDPYPVGAYTTADGVQIELNEELKQ